MKVVIAMDSFKGSLSSLEAGEAVCKGILKVDKNIEVYVRPLGDGGEGTSEALIKGMNANRENIIVTGPLGDPVNCEYGKVISTKTAIIDMSVAAGITLLPKNLRNPLYTTTYGVGEIIRHAIKDGCRNFIVGIGGSATNDCGVGMLQALGYRFLDSYGKSVKRGAQGIKDIVEISDEEVLPKLKDCNFKIACDVNNPLCGINGCSEVYGPQKGASPEMVKEMDSWLEKYSRLVARKYLHADPNVPGSGAAGGLGYAFLNFTCATLESGIEIVLKETKLEEFVVKADIVVTGEGCLDRQTVMGKAPAGVSRLAKLHNKPVIAFSGVVGTGSKVCNQHGIDAFFPILRRIITSEDAMEKETASQNLCDTSEQVFRLINVVK